MKILLPPSRALFIPLALSFAASLHAQSNAARTPQPLGLLRLKSEARTGDATPVAAAKYSGDDLATAGVAEVGARSSHSRRPAYNSTMTSAGARISSITASIVAIFAIGYAQQFEEADYAKVKYLIETIAQSTDYMGDRTLLEARSRLQSGGTAALPMLERAFLESHNDRFRMTAVGILFNIEGGRERAISIIETELAKQPGEWHGKQWVFLALNLLEEHDVNKARWGAKRALEAEDIRFLASSALGRLRRFGTLEDIAAIDAFTSRHSLSNLEGGLRLGILSEARGAIMEIKNRAISIRSGSPKAVGTLAAQESENDSFASKDKRVGRHENRPEKDIPTGSHIWWYITGAVATLTLVTLLKRRR